MAKKSLDNQFKKQINRIEKILDDLDLDIQIKDIKRPTLKTIENLKTITKSSLTLYLKGDSNKGKKHKNIKEYLPGIKSEKSKRTKVSSTKPKQTKSKDSSTKPKQTKKKVSSTKPKQTKNKVSSTKPKEQPQAYKLLKTEVILSGNDVVDTSTGEIIDKIDLSKYFDEQLSPKDNNDKFYESLKKDFPQYDFIKPSEYYSSQSAIDTEQIIDDRLEEMFESGTRGADILRRILKQQIEHYGKEVVYKSIAINQSEFFDRLTKAAHYKDDDEPIDKEEFNMNLEAISHLLSEGINTILGAEDDAFQGYNPFEDN